MSIFSDKTVKVQAVVTAVILLCLILAGQFAVLRMADGFRQSMIRHDEALAGYLSRTGLDEAQITRVFTRDKTDQDQTSGHALLSKAGYTADLEYSLLPDVSRFYRSNAPAVFLISAAFSCLLMGTFIFFARILGKRILRAEGELHRFLDGDTKVRIGDYGEGSLGRLFAAVNQMATSLTSHIEKEKQSRIFLKDTISDISHQLKTPLAALSMYNEIIGEEQTGNDVVDGFTSKSRRELTRMENLIQSLLKLARIDAGTIALEKDSYNLKDFLEECLSGFLTRAELEEKPVSLICDDSISLCFDKIWLREAVGNLIKNALDHTDMGDMIELNCRQSAVGTEITVKDSGTGISPEDIHHIFKRFYRSRFSKDRQGIGIGLSLSKAIVEQHGGTVTVESRIGEGASFHLIFPKLTNL